MEYLGFYSPLYFLYSSGVILKTLGQCYGQKNWWQHHNTYFLNSQQYSLMVLVWNDLGQPAQMGSHFHFPYSFEITDQTRGS